MNGPDPLQKDMLDMAASARRVVAPMIKVRARHYGRRPQALEALHPGLSMARPAALVAMATCLVERERRCPRPRVGFGGEITLVNARAALLLGRAQRRAEGTMRGRGEKSFAAPHLCDETLPSGTIRGGSCFAASSLSTDDFVMTSGLTLTDDAASAALPSAPLPPSREERLFATRRHSLDLAAPLSAEDQVVQASDDASPTKWHLAHVTWFFETFLLKPFLPSYRLFDERFPFCFNSYYEAEGARHPRGLRGLLTRPTHDEVLAYRAHVDGGLRELFAGGAAADADVASLIEVGINHEQQHQELLLTDILALFAAQPLRPAYDRNAPAVGERLGPPTFTDHDGGIFEIGHDGRGFAFDNEAPRHRALLRPYALADRLVTNGDWLAFMDDGGYETSRLWLADGWSVAKTNGWTAPLYWEERGGQWLQMGLHGLSPLDPAAPLAHVSFFEADAYARWAGHRLPTEFEWERAALVWGETGPGGPRQMFGHVWQWTQSAYLPYPGYRAAPGAIGEYNGKFMVSQHVLRGSSRATPPGHERPTYRNFFYPHQRWQFTGLRLASDR